MISTRGIVLFSFALIVFGLLIVRSALPPIVEANHLDATSGNKRLRGFLSKFLVIVMGVSLPVVGFGCALQDNFPPVDALRAGGLLVAAGYLLRMILVSQAHSRHDLFLQSVRRDATLNLITPDSAAIQLSWRLSGLPEETYLNARLRALSEEASQITLNIYDAIQKIEDATTKFQEMTSNEKSRHAEPMANWLKESMDADLASKVGKIVQSRADTFLTLMKGRAKQSPTFAEWTRSCTDAEAAATEYSRKRAHLIDLVTRSLPSSTSEKTA